MKIRSEKSHSSDFLFPLILFFVFALLSLFVILMSADVYGNIADESALSSNSDIAVSYVSQKIKRSGSAAEVFVSEEDGITCVVIRQQISGQNFHTYIYEHEGFLKELFANEAVGLMPAAGQKITEVSGFGAEMLSENLLKISCEAEDGKVTDLVVAVDANLS